MCVCACVHEDVDGVLIGNVIPLGRLVMLVPGAAHWTAHSCCLVRPTIVSYSSNRREEKRQKKAPATATDKLFAIAKSSAAAAREG